MATRPKNHTGGWFDFRCLFQPSAARDHHHAGRFRAVFSRRISVPDSDTLATKLARQDRPRRLAIIGTSACATRRAPVQPLGQTSDPSSASSCTSSDGHLCVYFPAPDNKPTVLPLIAPRHGASLLHSIFRYMGACCQLGLGLHPRQLSLPSSLGDGVGLRKNPPAASAGGGINQR